MDLRWGIREQSHDDHTIIEFCMREIDNCKRTSVGPTFVVSSTIFPIKQEAQLSLRDRATRCQLKSGKILHKCSTDCT